MQLWYLSYNYIKSEKENQRKAWPLGRHHMVKHSDKSHGKFSSVALDAPNLLGHEDMNVVTEFIRSKLTSSSLLC